MIKGFKGYSIGDPSGNKSGEHSEHTRSFLHDTVNDIIYLPAEKDIITMACKLRAYETDSVPIYETVLGKYLPISWYIKYRLAYDYEGVERMLRAGLKQGGITRVEDCYVKTNSPIS